jgi:hypothetical protein
MPNYGTAATSHQYCAQRFVQVAFQDIENSDSVQQTSADLSVRVGLWTKSLSKSSLLVISVLKSGLTSGSENAFWMLARVPDPCFVDHRFTRPKVVYCPSSTVYFVSPFSQARSLQDLVRVAVSLCPLSQKRCHQLLRFNKALSEFVQAQFTESGLRFGYQRKLAEVAEVPRDAV